MRCVVEPDPAVFAERVRPFLLRHRLEHNVLLGILAVWTGDPERAGQPVVCAYACDDGGAVVGVAVRTPPMRVVLSSMPPAAVVALEEALAAVDPDAPGVLGSPAAAALFAERRAARTGRRVRPGMSELLYALGELAPPAGVPGHPRQAGPADVPLVVHWWAEFAAEAVPGAPVTDVERTVRIRLRHGAMHLWEVDGEATAMAGYAGPVSGLARVAPVYTPPRHRRRGFGAAVTAATTAHALRQGADAVVLYTDLANPTSNALYQRIGYRPLAAAQEFDLHPPSVPG